LAARALWLTRPTSWLHLGYVAGSLLIRPGVVFLRVYEGWSARQVQPAEAYPDVGVGEGRGYIEITKPRYFYMKYRGFVI
jgi:hypothetical protein